ncbi:MAG: hypothetical protein ACI89U_003041 [Gammaproteobacteria bacterium]|jgi:hypothetical protein
MCDQTAENISLTRFDILFQRTDCRCRTDVKPSASRVAADIDTRTADQMQKIRP